MISQAWDLFANEIQTRLRDIYLTIIISDSNESNAEFEGFSIFFFFFE